MTPAVNLGDHAVNPHYLPKEITKKQGSPDSRVFYILKFKYARDGTGKPATGIILMSVMSPVLMDTCIVYTISHTGALQTRMEKGIFDGVEGRDEATNDMLWVIESAEILMTSSSSDVHVVLMEDNILICDYVLNETNPVYDEFSLAFADDVVRGQFRDDDFGTFADVFVEQLKVLAANRGLPNKFAWRKRDCGFSQGLHWSLTLNNPGRAKPAEENKENVLDYGSD